MHCPSVQDIMIFGLMIIISLFSVSNPLPQEKIIWKRLKIMWQLNSFIYIFVFRFLKVGNNPKSSNSSDDSGSLRNFDGGSWRQAIFKRVVTPRKATEEDDTPTRKRTKEELKILWKKSIYQAILLIRMEKENARIRGKTLY